MFFLEFAFYKYLCLSQKNTILTYKKPMDFSLSEEQIMIRDAARDFARTELLPGVIERDNLQKFPSEQVKKMGELGFL